MCNWLLGFVFGLEKTHRDALYLGYTLFAISSVVEKVNVENGQKDYDWYKSAMWEEIKALRSSGIGDYCSLQKSGRNALGPVTGFRNAT